MSALDGIEAGRLVPATQPAEGVSLAPKVTVADAQVNFGAPALAVDRRIRGTTPAPGAWTTFRGERLKLGPVSLAFDADGLLPGRMQVEKSRVLVGTATLPVMLGEVQALGKKAMSAADWARGVRPNPGERLGEPNPA